jgi:hypothetical protein
MPSHYALRPGDPGGETLVRYRGHLVPEAWVAQLEAGELLPKPRVPPPEPLVTYRGKLVTKAWLEEHGVEEDEPKEPAPAPTRADELAKILDANILEAPTTQTGGVPFRQEESGPTATDTILAFVSAYTSGAMSYDDALQGITDVFVSLRFHDVVAAEQAKSALGEPPTVTTDPGGMDDPKGLISESVTDGLPVSFELPPQGKDNAGTAAREFRQENITYSDALDLIRAQYLALFEPGTTPTSEQSNTITDKALGHIASTMAEEEIRRFYQDEILDYQAVYMLLAKKGLSGSKIATFFDETEAIPHVLTSPEGKKRIREGVLSTSPGGMGVLFNEFLANTPLGAMNPIRRKNVGLHAGPLISEFALNTMTNMASSSEISDERRMDKTLEEFGTFSDFLNKRADFEQDPTTKAGLLKQVEGLAPLFTDEANLSDEQITRRAGVESIGNDMLKHIVRTVSLMGVNPMMEATAVKMLSDRFLQFQSSAAAAEGKSVLDEFVDRGLNFFGEIPKTPVDVTRTYAKPNQWQPTY